MQLKKAGALRPGTWVVVDESGGLLGLVTDRQTPLRNAICFRPAAVDGGSYLDTMSRDPILELSGVQVIPSPLPRHYHRGGMDALPCPGALVFAAGLFHLASTLSSHGQTTFGIEVGSGRVRDIADIDASWPWAWSSAWQLVDPTRGAIVHEFAAASRPGAQADKRW